MKKNTTEKKTKTVWINIHIPKCAGSSFVGILRYNFDMGFADGRSYLSDVSFKYSSQHMREIITHFPYVRCFSDHKLTIDLPFKDYDIKAIAFIRKPVERFLSHYFYCRNDPINNFDPDAKRLNLEDYVKKNLLALKRADLWNGQMYHLTGSHTREKLQRVTELINDGHLYLFSVERFSEACVMLERGFPEDFLDCAYVVKNRSSRDQQISLKLREEIKTQMSLDEELYKMANQQMDNISESLFKEEKINKQTLIEFEQKCENLKRQINSPVYRGKLLIKAALERFLKVTPQVQAFITP
jgi:hypothetical protein